MFKLNVLVDNNTIIDKYFLGEPALSFFIEYDNKKILFDTGYSDVIIKNSEKMKLNLKEIDYIILSHGHDDHTGGLKHLLNLYKKSEHRPKIIACPDVFSQRYDNIDGDFGSPVPKEDIESVFKVHYVNEPFFLTENIVFLGPIPRINDFESKNNVGYLRESNLPDFVHDDSALAIRKDDKIIIITGCSHSGIINICDYAKSILTSEEIKCIFGGLHLQDASSEQLINTLSRLENLNLDSLYACHCTGFKALCKLSEVVNIEEVGSGLEVIV